MVLVEAAGIADPTNLNKLAEVLPAGDVRKIRSVHSQVTPEIETSQIFTPEASLSETSLAAKAKLRSPQPSQTALLAEAPTPGPQWTARSETRTKDLSAGPSNRPCQGRGGS